MDIIVLTKEIDTFLHSKQRNDMLIGEKYYTGQHDILKRERTAVGEEGRLTYLSNLPNNKVVDNQYARIVDQKVNYLLSKKPSIVASDEHVSKTIETYMTREFLRHIRQIGEASLNHGITYLHIYFQDSLLSFMPLEATEILPFWKDGAEEELEAVARIYSFESYEKDKKIKTTYVDYYTSDEVIQYIYEKDTLTFIEKRPHFYLNGKEGAWGKVPFVPFKGNSKQIPLISKLKSIQDAINEITNDFINHMQEDARNTIMVLLNYEGTDLGEFRKNLATYGAVKISTVDNTPGDVKTLKVEFDVSNYEKALHILKKAMFENGRGLDIRSDQMSRNPNQMNIETMYADLDLDANGIENEFQASFEQLFWFIKKYEKEVLHNDFTNTTIHVLLNRDMLINESEAIDNCKKSEGLIDTQLITANHPWSI